MTSKVGRTNTFLPTEIVQSILQLLEKSDLKSVRLTSHLYNCCATEFLFDTVYISAFKIDYEVFSAVAEHPHISKCIKHLKYDASQFFPKISWDSYQGDLCQQFFQIENLSANFSRDSVSLMIKQSLGGPRELSSRLDHSSLIQKVWHDFGDSSFVEEGYQKYLHFAQLQKSAADNEQYWMTVSSKLGKLTNLESAEICAHWYENHENTRKSNISPYDDFGRIGSPLARSWTSLHLLPGKWAFSTFLMRDPDASDGTSEFGIFNSFLMAASQPVKRLETILSIQALSEENIVCQQLMWGNFWPYERLEVLTLYLNHGHGIYVLPQTYQNLPGLPCLLRAASRLNRLKLELPRHSWLDSRNSVIDRQPYSLRDIIPFKAMIWHDLESFTIRNVSANALCLMMLLRFQMPNLRSLDIGAFELSQGSWLDVIECMHWYLNLSNFPTEDRACFLYPGANQFMWARHPEVLARFSSNIPSYQECEDLMIDIKEYIVHRGRHPWKDWDLPGSAIQAKSHHLTSSARKLMEQVEDSELLLHQ